MSTSKSIGLGQEFLAINHIKLTLPFEDPAARIHHKRGLTGPLGKALGGIPDPSRRHLAPGLNTNVYGPLRAATKMNPARNCLRRV